MRASEASIGRFHVSSTRQLHKNGIGLTKVSESCDRSCSFLGALHFLFLALMTRLSSGGLMSKIPVLNVSFNPPEAIVFVKQSGSIADVSIQRGQSTFDPSTSSSQSSQLSQMSCSRADKTIAGRLWSTVWCWEKSQSANQTCPIAAEAVSCH